MKRFYSLALAALAVMLLPLSSAMANMSVYQFSYGTGSQITLSSPTQVYGSGIDDAAAGTYNLGFDFVFDGTTYTTFGVSSNGLVRLGGTPVTTYSNSMTGASSYPVIMSWWDDLYTGSDGGVYYQMTGSSPNRVMTIEWRVNPCCSGTSYGTTHQVRLYEGSNKIEFWYGSNTNSWSGTIGAASSSSDFASITSGSTPSVSYTTANNNNSTWPGNGTLYTLSPCAANISIAGNTAQGGTTTMANGDQLFTGMMTQRGNTSSYTPFTVTNPANACGTRTYTYSLSGTNFADYQLSNTSGTLVAGATSTPTITFTPTGNGVRSATLTVTDNAGFSRTYPLAAQASTRIQWTGNIAQGGTSTVANGDTLMTNISVQRLSAANFTPVTVTNFNSNAAAPAAPITVSINDPSGQYTLVGPTSASLTANQSFSPVIRFAPTGVGFQNATLTITAEGETRVYPLKAYATAPGGEFFINNVKLSPAVPLYSNYFGCVGEVASTQAVAVVNVGSGDFVITSVDVFETDTVYGQGAPRYALRRDRFGNPIRMNDYFLTTAPGIAPPSANPPLQLPIVIPQGQTRTLYLTYVGQETGKRFGRLFINTNGQNFLGTDINGVSTTGLLAVDLFASGIGGRLSENLQDGSLKTITFDPVRVGDSSDVTYRMYNSGDCNLRISLEKLMIATGDVNDFRLLSAFGRTIVEGVPMAGDVIIAPDSSSSLTVRFKPQRNGSRRATIWIQTNDSSHFDGVSERGAYYLDIYGVGKAYLDYSDLKMKAAVIGGVASTGTVRVVNSSTATVGIQMIEIIGGDAAQFTQFDAAGAWPLTPFNLAPGAEMPLGVQFLPTGTPGARATTLRITTTTGEVINIGIRGEAGSQALTVSPSRLFVGNTTVVGNTPSRATVIISNTGTLPIRLNAPTITGPGASEYIPGVLARTLLEPGATEYLEITFAPTLTGPALATLTISSDAGSQTVSLEGTGGRTRPIDPTEIATGGAISEQPIITLNPNSNGTSAVRDAAAAAAGISFEAVRPNPARERAELVFTLAKGADVRLELYDGAGRLTREIASGARGAGEHRVTVDVSGLNAGVYHCRLATGGVELTRTVVVVK